MANTPKLGLPYLVASQAQKEITHNDALNRLDFYVQPVVQGRTNSPPPTPTEGDAYVITAGGLEAWNGQDDKVARWIGGAWAFYEPFNGFGVWSITDARDYVYSAGTWILRP